MQCLTIVLDVFSQILVPCVKAFREGSEKVRGLQGRAVTAEKRCSELEEKNREVESKVQALQEKLAAAHAKMALATLGLLWSMIFARTGVLVGLVVLGVVCGNPLLRLVERLKVSASQQIRHAIAYLGKLIECARNGIRSWKSVPQARSFSASQ
jgi:hypothetical protein